MDIETVCTHAALADEIGGVAELANLLPESFGGSSVVPRTKALADVLKALGRRTPPIWEESISDPSELRDAVTYGALERIYRSAMTTSDGVHATQRKVYDERFKSEVQGLSISVESGVRAPVGIGFPMERR